MYSPCYTNLLCSDFFLTIFITIGAINSVKATNRKKRDRGFVKNGKITIEILMLDVLSFQKYTNIRQNKRVTATVFLQEIG